MGVCHTDTTNNNDKTKITILTGACFLVRIQDIALATLAVVRVVIVDTNVLTIVSLITWIQT